MNVFTALDLNQNEMRNVRLQNLATAPSTPKLGQIYYDTTGNRSYLCVDSVAKKWVDITVANAGTLNNATLTGTSTIGTTMTDTATLKGVTKVVSTDKDLALWTRDETDPANVIFKYNNVPATPSTIFSVESTINGTKGTKLFTVQENGDTVIAGVLKVRGDGTSEFAGNVKIGGNLTVEGNATVKGVFSGQDFIVQGNLKVLGNTQLGDDATQDTTLVYGKTTIKAGVTKAVGSATTNTFEVLDSAAAPLFEVRQNSDVYINGTYKISSTGGAGGTPSSSTGGDLVVTGNLQVNGNTTLGDAVTDTTTVKGVTSIAATAKDLTLWTRDETDVSNPIIKYNGANTTPGKVFSVGTSLNQDLFKVLENGDTVIAGVLTVNGNGTSKFAGNVSIGGNLSVQGNATVKGIMSGQDFTIQGNLIVQGNTTLGDDVTADSVTMMSKATKIQSTTKDLALWTRDETDPNNPIIKYNGTTTAPTKIFSIESTVGAKKELFQVLENGDTVIAGVLTVNGNGTSKFSGNVSIGGNLTVLGNATVKGVMSGNDFIIQGNLSVQGNTTLGDDPAVDNTTINGLTVIKTAGNKTDGNAATTSVFKIQDHQATPVTIFDIRQNGDTIVGGTLTVSGSGSVTKDVTVDGNLQVNGNTTLGDGTGTDITSIRGELRMNANRITGVADPTGAQDAATKAYVDGVATGLDIKQSCRVATTVNLPTSAATVSVLTLSPAVTSIDGVTLAVNDRVLVKDQSAGKDNGIYVYTNSTTLTRAADADNTPSTNEVTPGMFTFIEEGGTSADTGWVLATNGVIAVGTTALSFTQFSGAGSFIAGAGLVRTGNVMDVVGTANRITVNADNIDIASTYAGQSTITTVGTVTTGTWNASAVGVAYGGTGATSLAAAKTAMGFMTRLSADLAGAAAKTQYIVAHGMGTADVQAQLYNKSSGVMVIADVKVDATNVTVDFGADFVGSTYRLVVMG